jgi:ribonuclease HI
MISPHESILRKKVKELDSLVSIKNYTFLISEEKWQEFAVSLECYKSGNPIGTIRIYYAPSKKSFRYDFRSLKESELIELLDQGHTKKTSGKHRNHAGVHAYVDGSYIKGKVGYGLAIIQDENLIFEDYGSVNNPEYLEARQVAGELMAVGKVVQWCKQHGHLAITIHYDYAGIREWAIGAWKAKQVLTQRYTHFIRTCGLSITWNKITAHTGDHWNEYVDKLAKQGAQE